MPFRTSGVCLVKSPIDSTKSYQTQKQTFIEQITNSMKSIFLLKHKVIEVKWRFTLCLLLFLNSAFSQDTIHKSDPSKMRLYIADGFRDEDISIYFNNKVIFQNIHVTSSPIYGLTGLTFELYVDSANNSNWILETHIRDSLRRYTIPIKKNIRLKIVDSNKTHKLNIPLTDISYFVLYKRNEIMYLEPFKFEPGFD